MAQSRPSLSSGDKAALAVGAIFGAAFLGLATYLLIRRKRPEIPKRPDIDPFTDGPARETVGPILTKKDALTPFSNDREIVNPIRSQPASVGRHRFVTTMTPMDGQTGASPVIRRWSNTAVLVNPDSRPGIQTGADAGSVDVLRLFEDRAFEPHLLRLISQRMDPVPNSGGEVSSERHGGDVLPAYLHANDES
jgi:hypothetical protein